MDVLKDSGSCYTRPCYTRKTEKQWNKNEDAVTTGHHLNEFILFHGFNNINGFLQANVGVEIAPKKSTFETETKSFQLLVNSYLPSCCFPKRPVPQISRQILFGEFEFSPTPETVSVAFGIKEDDPVKEWGSTNAENKANYGGASAWNLKKPAMQQDDDFRWLVGWLGPTSTVGAGVAWGGKQFIDFLLVKISWCFFQVIYSLHLEIPWFQIRLAVTRSMEKTKTFQTANVRVTI